MGNLEKLPRKRTTPAPFQSLGGCAFRLPRGTSSALGGTSCQGTQRRGYAEESHLTDLPRNKRRSSKTSQQHT